MNRALRGIGLDVPCWLVLSILDEDGERSMSDLAAQASANLSTMTKTVYRLQEQSLVQTRTSPNDARVTNVALTDLGKATLQDVEMRTAALMQRSTQGFKTPQLKRLNTQLARLLNNLS